MDVALRCMSGSPNNNQMECVRQAGEVEVGDAAGRRSLKNRQMNSSPPWYVEEEDEHGAEKQM